MRSSAILDGATSLVSASALWYYSWPWCSGAMVLVGLVNFAVKGQELYAGWSLSRRVAKAVAALKAEPPMEWALGRKFLVLLNPNAGAGRGGMIFAKCVRPVLEAAQVDFDTVETERAGHASDICCGLGAQGKMARGGVSYDAVVCVSGDGMLHEAINGFANKPQITLREPEILQGNKSLISVQNTHHNLLAHVCGECGNTKVDLAIIK